MIFSNLSFFNKVSNLSIRSCIWSPLFSLNRERFFSISNEFSTSLVLGATNSSSSSSISSTSSFLVRVAFYKIYSSVSVDDGVIAASSAFQKFAAVMFSGTRLDSFSRNSLTFSLISLLGSSSSLTAIVWSYIGYSQFQLPIHNTSGSRRKGSDWFVPKKSRPVSDF